MPMGIVSDSDFESELKINGTQTESRNNGVEKSEPIPIFKELPTKGRPEGTTEVPESIRKLIGEQANIEGRTSALELARGLGISDSSASAYANGATSTSTYNKADDELLGYINERRGKLTKRALNKLGHALALMTTSKLHECSGPQLAQVASVMSSVVKNLQPNQPENSKGIVNNNSPSFIFMVPPTKKETSYEVISSKE